MQIPIVNGIYTDNGPDFRTAYPVNLVPVPKSTGISEGYLRPAEGIVELATGPGIDRGGINWNGKCYRVMGSKLVIVTNLDSIAVIGDVGGGGSPVTMDYSFDRLAIASNYELYFWDGSNLEHVTDRDLGAVVDFKWIDGYFMTTDGESLVVTELTNPESINLLKYGSAEADPDPIKAILKIRNEIYALNRHTIEVFQNVGGQFFPFQRVSGGQIQKGALGTHACCVINDTIAFLGSGRGESPSIYLGMNASTVKIATREIDVILSSYTEAQLSQVVVEYRNNQSNQLLYAHLPDRSLVYDAAASEAMQQPIWHILTSSSVGFEEYRARHAVWCYDKWIVGDTQSNIVGYLTNGIGSHWGQDVRWEFGTSIVYNSSRSAIFNELELVALPRVEYKVSYPPAISDVRGTAADLVTYPASPVWTVQEFGETVTLAAPGVARTSYARFGKNPSFSASVSDPYQTDGPGGAEVTVRRVTLPAPAAGDYPAVQWTLTSAPHATGAPASLWVRRVGGVGTVVRLLHGGTAGSDPLDARTVTDEWQLLTKTTRTQHYYWGLGLRPGDVAVEVEVAMPMFGTTGRWIPVTPATTVPVSATDITSYTPATGALILGQPATDVRADGQPCTGSGTTWTAPATVTPQPEGIIAGWVYSPATGQLTTPATKPGAPLYADGVPCSGAGTTWTVPPVEPVYSISTSYSTDGLQWSQEKYISAGNPGDTSKRLIWYRQGHMRNWRIQRFSGLSSTPIAFARLEAQIEPLVV